MAKKQIALEVTLTAGQAAAELDKLNKAATDTANSVDKVDTEFKTLKQQLKEAQQEAQLMAQKFGDTSKEAVAAQKKVAALKDEVGDFNARVEALNPEAKFKAFAQVAQGVASGFAAAQGAAALFGAESEDVQKALLKLQAAMAIAQGVEGLMGLGDSFKTLKVVAVDAMNGIKTAFLANPLFAIGAAVLAGLSAAAIYFASTVDDGTESIKKQGEMAQKAFDAEVEALEHTIALRRANGEEVGELEAEKIKILIEGAKKEIEIAQRVYEEKRKLAMKEAEDAGILDVITGNLAVKKANGEAARTAKKFEQTEEGMELAKKLNALEKDLEIKTTENTKKELDKRKRAAEEYEAKRKALLEQRKKDEEERAKRDAEQREREKKADEEDAEFIRKQSEERQKQIQAEADAKKKAEEEAYQYTIKLHEDEQERKRKALELEAQIREKNNELIFTGLETGLNVTGNLIEASMNKQLKMAAGNEAKMLQIRKQAFERNKKLQIAQTLVNTYQSATAAYASQLLPADPTSPIRGAIAASLAVASGLANVAQIASQRFDGGGSGGGSASAPQTIPDLAAPDNSPNNNTGSTQLNRDQIEAGNAEPIKVFVTETDITSSQNRVNRIQARATID